MKREIRPQQLCMFLGVVLLMLYSAQVSFAQYKFELTPGITVAETYDDNIFLEDDNEDSDYITELSPSLHLNILSQKTVLELEYFPTFVWYQDLDQNDTTRHTANIVFGHDHTEHLRFDLANTYLQSEDPLEETLIEGVEAVVRGRNEYQRNTFESSFRYLFGEEDTVTAGYRNSLLENDDDLLDDGTIQTPFVSLTYWLNVKNGVEFDYEYTIANFSNDDESIEAGDDFTGNGAGVRYLYRFTEHTTGSAGYRFTNRRFDGGSEDYDVHEGLIGFEQAFSPDLSVSLEVGFFALDNERSDDDDGYSYDASLEKSLERGTFTIGGRGGWGEAYLEAERRGFLRYWSAYTNFEYQILEHLSCHGEISYRQDERLLENLESSFYDGNVGVNWTFLQWFSLSLEYRYAERDDDVDTDDYKVNRVMLTLTASKLFDW